MLLLLLLLLLAAAAAAGDGWMRRPDARLGGGSVSVIL